MSRHAAPRMPWHQIAARAGFWFAVTFGILFLPALVGNALGDWLITEFL